MGDNLYDLTSFFQTIAGSSASIVAILGGLIASRLLTLNTEREMVKNQILEIEEQQRFKQEQLLLLTNQNIKNKAIVFIRYYRDSLIKGDSIDFVYKDSERYDITKKDVQSYWKRAEEISSEVVKYYQSGIVSSKNSDNIPDKLACKFSNDEFDYEVCKMVYRYIIAQQKKDNANSFGISFPTLEDIDAVSVSDTINEKNIENNIYDLIAELKWIKLTRKQLLDKRDSLKKPDGLKAGLIIFVFFSIAFIVVPVSLCPFSVCSSVAYYKVKVLFVLAYIIGLGLIFGYLVYLLKWD